MSLARRRSVGACTLPTGGTCREDPIPPGYYWIDSVEPAAFGADEEETQHARELYTANVNRQYPGSYKILQTVPHSEGQYDYDWVLFQVLSPIPRWPNNAHWGLPTVAPKGANTQEGDTVQVPPPEANPLDNLLGGDGVPSWTWVAVGAAGVLGIAYLLR